MSNIRLKQITIEPSQAPLVLKDGNISIEDSTVSINLFTGSFITNGGIGINCTYDSISSTSGGALTIGGGIAINKSTFLGGNFILDNSYSTFSINGISTNRLFLDTITNKNFYISPDGINKRFDLYDGSIFINITTPSTNLTTGALVINGGLSINSTGKSLLIGGYSELLGNVRISNGLTVNNLFINYGNTQISLQRTDGNLSSINVDGNEMYISNDYNIILSTTSGNININSNENNLSITNSNTTLNKLLLITDTTNSINSTTGALLLDGGLSINCAVDSVSFTEGGAFTINGGMGVSGKIYTGDSIGLEIINDSKPNKLVLYSASDLTETIQFTGLGTQNGSMILQIPDPVNDYIFYAGNSNEIFRIKGTNEVIFKGLDQSYSILAGGSVSSALSIRSDSVETDFSLDLFNYNGNAQNNVELKLFGLGQPNYVVDSEYLSLGWSNNSSNYIISTNNTGTGNKRDLVLQSGIENQLVLSSNGTIQMYNTKVSVNSTFGSLILYGGLSINCEQTSMSITQGGALTVNGGMSVKKDMYIGDTLNINTVTLKDTIGSLLVNSTTASFVFSGNGNGNLTSPITLGLFSLGQTTSGNYELLNLNLDQTNSNGMWNINSKSSGTGILRAIRLSIDPFSGICLATNGNMGINTTLPSYDLDINGILNVNTYSFINGLQITNTEDAYDLVSTGSLHISGGATVDKNLNIGGLVSINNSTDSFNTQGALTVVGGITILNGQSSNYGSGALTVNGGGYFGGEVYIQQNLNVAGQINGGEGSSSTFSYLTLTATDQSTNLSTGTLVTFGGITIQTYANSQNVSNGGSLLTPGGASIGKDLYIGGNLYNYGISNYYVSNDNIMRIYDTSNILRFSVDRIVTSNNFGISRYNSLGALIERSIVLSNQNGMITLNNSTESLNKTTGSLITLGGITINCTTDSVSLNNGGALTIAGGTSISKNLFVGGNTVFSNTTDSTDSSTGSVIIYGGVGIGGNVNVAGNTIISGNLTIMGTTTSIETNNTTLKDNVFLLNSGPVGSKDSGILISRYQNDNDTASGDVVADAAYFTDILPNQSGMSSTQVKLSNSASAIDNAYSGWWIEITSGFSSNQVRKITGYNGTTKIATVSSAWTSQNPSIGDSISLFNKPYVGIIYNETNDRFEFCGTVQDSTLSTLTRTDTIPIYFSKANSTSTQPSTNCTTGGIVATGGISSSCTTDSYNSNYGGALTIAGGAAIGKSLFVGNNAYVNGVNITPNSGDVISTVTFTAGNNNTFTNLDGLSFGNDNSIWGADLYLSVQIIANASYYSNYHLRAVFKQSSNIWDFATSYVGDATLSFNITNTGQVQYKIISDTTGFVSCIFKYKVVTN